MEWDMKNQRKDTNKKKKIATHKIVQQHGSKCKRIKEYKYFQ